MQNKENVIATPILNHNEQSHNNNLMITSKNEKANEFLQTKNKKINAISINDLLDTTYPANLPIVDSLLYSGCVVLAGPPKTGKSFLMLQLAHAVSTGEDFLSFKTNIGDVLYLALEDTENRIQRRYCKMFDLNVDNNRLFFSTMASTLNQGLFFELEDFLSKKPETKLIIIDTLAKIKELQENSYSYNSDYDIIGKIKNFADEKNICIIVIHHLRKQADDNDIFNTISGSTGITGAVDASFILKKCKRSDNKAILYATGRDTADSEFELEQNKKNFIWTLCKIKNQNNIEDTDELIIKISKFITKENPIWTGNATELIELLRLNIIPNALTRKLNANTTLMLSKFNLLYNSYRTHKGRFIEFQYYNNK